MTAREAIHLLNSKGWSNTQIAAAMGRGRGQIINISSGRASGAKLQGALEALSRRSAPPKGFKPPVARGAAKPPPKRLSGGQERVARRGAVGSGASRRKISQSLPGHTTVGDIRRELLSYNDRRVRLVLLARVNGRPRSLVPYPKGIKGKTLREVVSDMGDLTDWLIEHHYLDPGADISVSGWLIEEVK